jgi:hypothetical protein
MHENNGRELVPQRGPPDRSPSRQYTVNLGRKRDWLDRVGEFLQDGPYENRKQERFHQKIQMAAGGLVLATAFFCGMDVYNWNFNKAGDDFLHAMPFGAGDKTRELMMNATCPPCRARAGEPPEETQRRRECIDAVLFKYDDRYIVARKLHPRAPLDFCEAPAVATPAKEKERLVK